MQPHPFPGPLSKLLLGRAANTSHKPTSGPRRPESVLAHNLGVARYSGTIPRASGIASSAVCVRLTAATCKSSARRLSVLWKSHRYNIPTARFGFVEALVRDLEQLGGR